MTCTIVVIGALSSIGRSIVGGLAEAGYRARDIAALEHQGAAQRPITFRDQTLWTQPLETFSFAGARVAFLCTPALLSAYVIKMKQAGTKIIDCVGLIGEEPCIIPSLNIWQAYGRDVLLNPTNLTAVLAQVLAPIHERFDIREVAVTALLSAEEFGVAAGALLAEQTQAFCAGQQPAREDFQIWQAFNLIPEIYPTLNRQTADQMKALFHFPITLTTCLTPVFRGACYAITVTTRQKCSCRQLMALFRHHPVCRIQSDYRLISTQQVTNQQVIEVAHIGCVPYRSNTFYFWALCDPVRVGAVANALGIAAYLLS